MRRGDLMHVEDMHVRRNQRMLLLRFQDNGPTLAPDELGLVVREKRGTAWLLEHHGDLAELLALAFREPVADLAIGIEDLRSLYDRWHGPNAEEAPPRAEEHYDFAMMPPDKRTTHERLVDADRESAEGITLATGPERYFTVRFELAERLRHAPNGSFDADDFRSGSGGATHGVPARDGGRSNDFSLVAIEVTWWNHPFFVLTIGLWAISRGTVPIAGEIDAVNST